MPFASERLSHAGGREPNEDTCGELWVGNAGCWAVADGLGGHRGGETASSVAVQAVMASFQSNPELSASALKQHLEAAHQSVLAAQKEQPTLASMRTTIVVLITDSRQALWAHVGDSRLYVLDAGRIVACTKDHSVVQAMVNAGDLSPRDIRRHPDRNRLLRALGNPESALRFEIVSRSRTLRRGTALLLCTDGFWENVTEGEMEIDLAKAENPRDWLARMETRLLERVTGESDNYTALAVFADSESAPGAPAPNVTEDQAMNGSSGMGQGIKFALAGIMLLALAAVGVWDGLLLRQVRLATEQESQALQQLHSQPPSASSLDPQLSSELAKLDRLCSDSKFKALCAGTQSPSGAVSDRAADPSADGDGAGDAQQKAKKPKEAAKRK